MAAVICVIKSNKEMKREGRRKEEEGEATSTLLHLRLNSVTFFFSTLFSAGFEGGLRCVQNFTSQHKICWIEK